MRFFIDTANLADIKEAYDLENTSDAANHVSLEHYYDVAKRKLVKKETADSTFNK